jgi:hypothetical protein
MSSIGKPVLIASAGLVVFALLAQFVEAALFGGLIYAWIAIALAVHCLLVPEQKRHTLVNLHAGLTGGHVPVHLGFAAVLFVAGCRAVRRGIQVDGGRVCRRRRAMASSVRKNSPRRLIVTRISVHQ